MDSVKTLRRHQCRLLRQQCVCFRISDFRATARYEVLSVWHELAQKHHLDMLVLFFRLVLHRHAGGSVAIAKGRCPASHGRTAASQEAPYGLTPATQLEFLNQSQLVVYSLSFLFFSRLPHFIVYPVFAVAAATSVDVAASQKLTVAASAKRSCARFELSP